MVSASYFNPRSPHGERHSSAPANTSPPGISIHAPRTGSDYTALLPPSSQWISIHAPRTGSDVCDSVLNSVDSLFQSTLPARGATFGILRCVADLKSFQSTLPARGATAGAGIFQPARIFQSTLPARGATWYNIIVRGWCVISIHAPRTGSDDVDGAVDVVHLAISIHAPRTGSDLRRNFLHRLVQRISIHAPRTGSDPSPSGRLSRRMSISIHAPRTGSDLVACYTDIERELFQSTLPARGATYQRPSSLRTSGYFNPRSPHGERRTSGRHPCGHPAISIHAPRTGSDERPQPADAHGSHFNPRSPHGERPAVRPVRCRA